MRFEYLATIKSFFSSLSCFIALKKGKKEKTEIRGSNSLWRNKRNIKAHCMWRRCKVNRSTHRSSLPSHCSRGWTNWTLGNNNSKWSRSNICWFKWSTSWCCLFLPSLFLFFFFPKTKTKTKKTKNKKQKKVAKRAGKNEAATWLANCIKKAVEESQEDDDDEGVRASFHLIYANFCF